MLWVYQKCKLVRVIDGDTFVCDIDVGFDTHCVKTVRLRGVNCPERKTTTKAAGDAAKDFTEQLLRSGPVVIHSHGWDKYRRVEAEVTLADGRDLGQTLIECGHAVALKR